MNSSASQTYLKTRVNIFATQLFTDNRILELLDMPLEELSGTFGLTGIIESPLSPQKLNHALEQSLLHSLMSDLSVLLRPLDGTSRVLLIYWSRKFALFNLKTLIRCKLNELSLDEISSYLHHLPDIIRLPHEKLLQAENILEMLHLLEHGPYQSIARQARQVYEEKNEPFSLDAAIDRSYFQGMVKYSNSQIDRGELKELIGMLTDRQNLLWLLRYRFMYQLSSSETYYLLVPFGKYLDRNRLMELVNLDSFQSVLEKLPPKLSRIVSGTTNAMQARQRLDFSLSREMRRLIRFSPSPATRALAYLVARDTDLKRLNALLQGKLLGLDSELVHEALIPPALQEAA
ncbi:MAG: ATPase [Gammaproteobacteria bacterium (ex Lamellibrachia satsuma)]|nr:MAG: V-type ATPase subunit [Gammaproteobacteria bacterium (ex Lamellibrachia satsuma)]RRS31796.1 MAG: ATPase [Gammaproteobacteria bacterium (ex Lamellibrachia satsuma)]RRS33678.1 MAG: ATPase [Gammaproteobacteria bacterium (ex Lamellibrachia satsuma)]